jgi:ferredoxin-thioredoxin reductase catalytic subunit
MGEKITVPNEEIDEAYSRFKQDAEAGGYNLTPDVEFAKQLIRGILVNQKRYGYGSCPCRLASGNQQNDTDIICPCDYRDPDLNQFGCCYCGLYVSDQIKADISKLTSIPERRPPPDKRKIPNSEQGNNGKAFPLPVWRCKVCGYLCARETPPQTCPICKAKDRFERFG